MGSYSPAADVGPDEIREIVDRVIRPTIDGMRAEGRPYRGVLYAGLMLTADGPKVLEVNSSPGFEGLERATKADVAGMIIAHAAGRAASKKATEQERQRVI